MDTLTNNILITLIVVLVIASVCLVSALWEDTNMSNWRKISDEINNKCRKGDIYCQGYIMYKYGEGEEFEKIVKYCHKKYKDKCQLANRL